MSDSVNFEKLAGVFNRASAEGKSGFCKMLWGNQSESIQSQLLPFLSEQAQNIINEKS